MNSRMLILKLKSFNLRNIFARVIISINYYVICFFFFAAIKLRASSWHLTKRQNK